MTTYELTELALKAGKGNTEALTALVDHTLVDVRNIVRNRVPSAESDEIQQDIWYALIRYLPRYEGRSSFSTWLYSVVIKRIADHQRERCRERARNLHIAAHLNRNREQMYSMDTDMVVEDIIARCPKTYREVLRLHLCDGMTFVEIEAETGIRREAARSRYRRGVAWLQSNAARLGIST